MLFCLLVTLVVLANLCLLASVITTGWPDVTERFVAGCKGGFRLSLGLLLAAILCLVCVPLAVAGSCARGIGRFVGAVFDSVAAVILVGSAVILKTFGLPVDVKTGTDGKVVLELLE